MNLINAVYDSLRFKKNDEYCAEKTGISLEKYQEIKSQILHVKGLLQTDLDDVIKQATSQRLLNLLDDADIKDEYISQLEESLSNSLKNGQSRVIETRMDLDAGTVTMKALASVEPKTPEEIEEILKIDKSKWYLSTYWNKEHKGYWLISAQVTRIKPKPVDFLSTMLENWVPKYTAVTLPKFINTSYSEDCSAVISVQDLHFGKKDNQSVKDAYLEAIRNLVYRAYASHKLKEIVLIVGGDLLNMDTFNGTTTKGTPVENGMDAVDAYECAFDAKVEAIEICAQFCETLHVYYLPGNHDRLSSFHLAHGLSKVFKNNPSIVFHAEYDERKVHTFGKSFIGMEHGDVSLKLSPLTFATEFGSQWGAASFRVIYSGHWHKKKTVEYVVEDETNGIDIKILPSLCNADYYHKHNKWTGNKKRAVLEVHGFESGPLGQLYYIPKN
jgi:hypothetical protein